jgi:hypothetical protein
MRSDNKVRKLTTVCLRGSSGQKPHYGLMTLAYQHLLKMLYEKVRQKRPELSANNSWILHHDNATAHTTLYVREFLASKQITVLQHPPYSPYLAPSDFFLFPKIRKY